jgi:hypothetical protein
VLSDGQRRSIGAQVMTMRNLVHRLRELGMTSPALAELGDELSRIEAESGAIPPGVGSEAHGLLAEGYVLALGFNARGFRSYGEVTQESGAWLDEHGRALQGLMQRLLRDL